MVIFWTLQQEECWERAKQLGYLIGDEEFAGFQKEYLWMMEQMKKRLPNYQGEYPIWVWLEKPDMRQTGHFPGGTKCVRLKLEIDEKDVLVSYFDDWHCVLNRWFCSDSEEEAEAFETGLLPISMEESWERIFELDRIRDPEWHGRVEDRKLQGVTGKIDMSKVKSVEHFVARKSEFDI